MQIACAWVPFASGADAAQSGAASFPNRPVRIIVRFAPGGNIDINARAVAPGLAEALGQPFIVDNRGGAGGRIGAALVAKSPPDGYTLLLGASGTLTVQPAFTDNPGYDPLRDFAFTPSRFWHLVTMVGIQTTFSRVGDYVVVGSG